MVYVTTKTDNPTQQDFVRLDQGNYETADYTGWRRCSYDLSAYAGQQVKLAIRYISDYNRYGSFMLMVDDVYVGQKPLSRNEVRGARYEISVISKKSEYRRVYPRTPRGRCAAAGPARQALSRCGHGVRPAADSRVADGQEEDSVVGRHRGYPLSSPPVDGAMLVGTDGEVQGFDFIEVRGYGGTGVREMR